MADRATLDLIANIRNAIAADALTASQAKLYSEKVRRSAGQPGLTAFTERDVQRHLSDASLLLSTAFIEKESDAATEWRQMVKRAAEILEWLSHPAIAPANAPVSLLAGAAYQAAGYPAMAVSLLRVRTNDDVSELLRDFLRADFAATRRHVAAYWEAHHTDREQVPEWATVEVAFVQHIVMCIGIVCAYLRSGDEERIARSLDKLTALTDSLIHSRDSFSHLLGALTSMAARTYVDRSLWTRAVEFRRVLDEHSDRAFVQFARAAFANKRALVWPAQEAGIRQLASGGSFVLCTPTGSGKTTVATLAIIQELLRADAVDRVDGDAGAGLILYLVPSRALAAEVEARLAEDLSGTSARRVVVTGLYGGIDWGPTDAWIQNDEPTVVICTFEKADALIRYLGVLFLSRAKLVIIDEAHAVEQAPSTTSDGLSRAFRLEQLVTRLLEARESYGFRLIGLSAVAGGAGPALARWFGDDPDAMPVVSDHRSTRQMLGRLAFSPRRYTIAYDLMDGRPLRFEGAEGRADVPFVPNPFPPLPEGTILPEGPEVRSRIPTLWAGMNLAAERPDGVKPSVLISVTQNVDTFAATCADQLDTWSPELLPNYRRQPDQGDSLWERCLAAAADYFGTQSVEYRLLAHGVALHHGRLPSLFARRLKRAIDFGYVRVVIATSTLSEGVNIPVSYVLVPSLFRANTRLQLSEFANLMGRAGRPAVSTEGQVFVVMPEGASGSAGRPASRQWRGYGELLAEIQRQGQGRDQATSPLAQLLHSIEESWRLLAPAANAQDFREWLEQTAVADVADDTPAIRQLDALDGFLLAAIEEVEQLRAAPVAGPQLEEELSRVWRRTYAHAALTQEDRLRETWLIRGRRMKDLYPDEARRRRIYRSSLSPRSATALEAVTERLREAFNAGRDYAGLALDAQLRAIYDVLRVVSEVPSFAISERIGRRAIDDWEPVLRWWLAPWTVPADDVRGRVSDWYAFVAQNFIYRGTWGIGSALGVLLDLRGPDGAIRALEIADWPRSGLPWFAFWMKDLLTWGTLDPVAAFLLARGNALDRPSALRDARQYYAGLPDDMTPNDRLDPRRIRDWLRERQPLEERGNAPAAVDIPVRLLVAPETVRMQTVSVLPIRRGQGSAWIDAAGYLLAEGAPLAARLNLTAYDFTLSVPAASVRAVPFRPHA